MAIQLLNSARLTTEAFEQLFFEYQPRLVRFAVRYLEEEAAEDIVQNAFLKLWEKRDEVKLDNIQALLFQMVRNECLNELKHRAVLGTESLDGLMEVEGSEQLYWQDFAPDADAVLIGLRFGISNAHRCPLRLLFLSSLGNQCRVVLFSFGTIFVWHVVE